MSSNKSLLRKEIRSIIQIIDTRNLSDEQSEKQYDDWWCGEKDECYLTNKMFDCCEDIMSSDEWDKARIFWDRATPDETLDYIEDFINKQE